MKGIAQEAPKLVLAPLVTALLSKAIFSADGLYSTPLRNSMSKTINDQGFILTLSVQVNDKNDYN